MGDEALRTAHGGQVWALARTLRRNPDEILDFSASINPWGPPESVKRAIQSALDGIRFYPDVYESPLANRLAHHHDIPRSSLFLANGASEAIDLALRTRHPRRVVILHPAFSEYQAAARRSGLTVLDIPLDPGFDVPWQAIHSHIESDDLLILNNPHNPSGRVVLRDAWWSSIRQVVAQGASVLIDEAFLDFLPDSKPVSFLPDAALAGSGLLVVRSLTKFYSLPGLRLGYAIGDPAWVAAIQRTRDPWSVNQLAQAAGQAAICDEAFQRRTHEWLPTVSTQIQTLWPGTLPVDVQTSPVNFFTVTWPSAAQSQQLATQLRAQGVLVRESTGFDHWNPAAWRIGLKKWEENQQLHDLTVQLFRQLSR